MRVFGAEPPPVQPPQGRSGKFRTRFSLVTTGAAGQSSGSRSPKAAQAAARSSPDPDGEPCRSRTPARDPERMLHLPPGLRRLRLGRNAARRQRPALGAWQSATKPRDARAPHACRSHDVRHQSGPDPPRRAEAGPKASGRDVGGRSLRMVHQTPGVGADETVKAFPRSRTGRTSEPMTGMSASRVADERE